jgi:hypothetical protein
MDQVPFVGQVFRTGAQATPPSGSYVRTAATTDTDADFYQGGYIYHPASPQQRRVVDNGFIDSVDADDVLNAGTSTQVGYFIVGRDFGVAIPPDTVMEYHPLLPVLNADRLPGVHTLINRALRSMRWVRRISFTGNAGDRYTLAAYPEITQDAQVAAAYMAESGSLTEPSSLYGGARLRWDGNTAYLLTGQIQSSSQTFTVDFNIPASAWIETGGTWAASTVGLVNETDEAMPPVDQVVTVARYFAFDALSRYAPSEPDRQAWMYERDRAAVVARQMMHFQQPQVNDRTRTVMRTGVAGAYGTRSWP